MTEVKKSRAFTLVELLVVISIIALLLAILVPALGRARNQARLVTCSANAKQIGTVMEVYQADNDGFVPVMRNRFTPINAKSAFLSLPFRRYSGTTVVLPDILNPDDFWDANPDGLQEMYFKHFLPDFYICPFGRGSKQVTLLRDIGTIRIGTVTRKNYMSSGRMESYSTWLWPRPKNFDFWPEGEHPWGSPNGYNKYGNVVWHTAGSPDSGNPDDPYSGHSPDSTALLDIAWLEAHPRKFANVRRIAEKTALFCGHGELDESNPQNRIINYGSHKKSNRGGTNVVFGDSHVEWVQGSQISAGD